MSQLMVSDPIHLPCPDMAGCVNPSHERTLNSLAMVAKLRERFASEFAKNRKKRVYIPARFRVSSFEEA